MKRNGRLDEGFRPLRQEGQGSGGGGGTQGGNGKSDLDLPDEGGGEDDAEG